MVGGSENRTLSELGLRALRQIPEHIPTLKWEWVISERNKYPELEFMFAAFSERVEANSSKAAKIKQDKEHSCIE